MELAPLTVPINEVDCPKHGKQTHWNKVGECGICQREVFEIGWKAKHPWDRKYVLEALGFKNTGDAKMPKDFECTQTVYNGHILRVYPSKPKANGGKTSKHRIFVVCNCRREVPFGRMEQHLPACRGGK
jgi:hypothetical protein